MRDARATLYDANAKPDLLLSLVKQERETALVFTRTKHRADQLGRVLRCAGHRVAVLHGDRSLSQRRSALDGFKRGVFRVLVGTDIAARGIDVANIGHVINFDLPHCPADEGHRTGHEFCDGGRPTAASCHRTSAWACRPAGVRQSTTIVR